MCYATHHCAKTVQKTYMVSHIIQKVESRAIFFLIQNKSQFEYGNSQHRHSARVWYCNPTERFVLYSDSYCFYLSYEMPRAKLVRITSRWYRKCREPWRPKRRRRGINTASRASSLELRHKLRSLLNASFVDWTSAISLHQILGSTRPSSWPDRGGCHGPRFLMIC